MVTDIHISGRQEINLKHSVKIISVILSLIIIISTAAPLTAGAVNYPQGVTQEQILAVIPKLNNIVKGLMSAMPQSADIKSTVYATLCKDETLNGLFSGIYGALGENADSLSILGIDLSPASLSRALKSYPSVSKKIASCKTLDEVVKASEKFKWEVTTKNGFTKAVSSMLSPFNSLLNMILCSGSVRINDLISIHGDDGYSNVIVPLLKAMDCPSVMSSADFSASAAKSYSNIIKNILSMVFDSIDKLLDDPVIGMCETLPKLIYYFDSGKLSESITSLLEPLSLKIAGIITIPGLSDLISNVANFEEEINLNELMGDMDLSDLTGSSVSLTLPEIDLSQFSQCVTDNGGTLTVDKGAAFITLMNFITDTLRLNKDNLGALMGGEAGSQLIPSQFFEKTNDEMIYSIVTLFNITSAPENNAQLTYPAFTPGYVTYTPNLTAEDYAKIIDKFDPLLTDFVKESDPEGNIEDTLRKTIYSNATLSQIVVGLYSVIGSEETAGLFSMLGMNVTPAGVAASIYSSYPYAASTLSRYGSWEKVNPDYLSWGFYDGNADAFERALTRVLSPFIPILSCILAGSNVTFMNAITLPGANGYNTAVIPLLEALGCNSEKIKPYAEYVKGAGTEKVLTDIFDPVFALIDEICASPVKTICRILPNIIYFFEGGLMEASLNNLLYPIDYILSQAKLSDLLDGAFDTMPEMDINSLIGSFTASADMGISLPEIDFSAIGTYGTATTLTSKRVVNGAPAQYTYITSDSPAVILTILRVLVTVMTSEENGDMLSGLMGGSGEGENDMFAMYAADITKKFEGMTSDEVLEWLCDLFFSESPVAEPEKDEEIPEIIYKKKFKLPSAVKFGIIFGIIALAALVYYILSVTGKLDNHKLKKGKKKEAKRRAKESKLLVKAGGTPVQGLSTQKKPQPRPQAIPQQKTQSESQPIPKPQPKPQAQSPAINPEGSTQATYNKDTSIASARYPDAKSSEKLDSRLSKAEKQAEKTAIKNQKQYDKIIKQAAKKK